MMGSNKLSFSSIHIDCYVEFNGNFLKIIMDANSFIKKKSWQGDSHTTCLI